MPLEYDGRYFRQYREWNPAARFQEVLHGPGGPPVRQLRCLLKQVPGAVDTCIQAVSAHVIPEGPSKVAKAASGVQHPYAAACTQPSAYPADVGLPPEVLSHLHQVCLQVFFRPVSPFIIPHEECFPDPAVSTAV